MNEHCEKIIRYYNTEEIQSALSSYHKEHRLIKKLISTPHFKDQAEIEVRLEIYPFTVEKMPYASINLINLAVEQALIVHFDYLVSANNISGLWENLIDYRDCVAGGSWLVPKIETRILSPVPLEKNIQVVNKFGKIKFGSKRIVLEFLQTCGHHFTSSGIAIFEKNKVFLREV